MRISRIQIRNFKSIREIDLQNIADLNVVVGKNNTGKSNILGGLQLFFNRFDEGWTADTTVGGVRSDFWFKHKTEKPVELTVSFVLSSADSDIIFHEKILRDSAEPLLKDELLIRKSLVFDKPSNTTHMFIDQMKWGYLELIKPVDLSHVEASQDRFMSANTLDREYFAYRSVIQSGTIPDRILRQIDKKFALIPAKRRIRDEKRVIGRVPLPFDGTNLKNIIQNLKNSRDPAERNKYRQIKGVMDELPFTAGVMESISSDEQIDVTFDRGDLSFPISSQGIGIQETILFVVNLILCEGYIFGIEEPENHLHFAGQDALLKFMSSQSHRNQIFITTHSPLFVDRLDPSLGRIFLTRLVDEETKVSSIENLEDFSHIVYELGRVSNLLDPDAVVFVEGRGDISIFETIVGTIKLFARTRVEFVDMSGKYKLPYFAAIKTILKVNRDLPFFYVLDADGKSKDAVVSEICETARRHVELDEESMELLRNSIFVLSKPSIESYLLKPQVVGKVFGIPVKNVEEYFEKSATKKNKFYVLDSLLRTHGKGRYDKILDASKIAKNLTEEDIDPELVSAIQRLLEISRR